jgi:hypothetical protein
MVKCVKKFIPLFLIYLTVFQRINRKWEKMENECKIYCQPDYLQKSNMGKNDSSSEVHIFFINSRLKLQILYYNIFHYFLHFCEPGSSVSIVSNYGMDDWASIPNRGRGFFL